MNPLGYQREMAYREHALGQGRTRKVPVPAPVRLEKGSELPGPVRRVFGWHTQIPGCAYYRVQLPLRTLGQQRGWHTRFGQALPLTERLADRLDHGYADAPAEIAMYMAERFDVIVGQQIGAGGSGADVLWRAMARHRDRTGGPMLVLETDDDLMNLHAGHLDEARAEMLARGAVYRRAIEMADVVTCTTPALADSIKPYAAGRVAVIPNYIDQAMFDVPGGGQHFPGAPRILGAGLRARGGPTLFDGVQAGTTPRWPDPDDILIGWGGSSTHVRDFALCWPALQRLLANRRDVCFASAGVVHHVDDPRLARAERRNQIAGLKWLDMDTTPWTEYWRRLGWYDIGLAPLETNRFNAAKSWIKILEYAAMGVPFVASASPEYRRFLDRPDMTATPPGWLVHSDTEHAWYATLRAITGDRALLQRMQGRARIYARGFTIQDHIGEWADALSGR